MGGRLVQLRSDGATERIRLGSEAFRIGRDPSMDLVLDAPGVSRQHARIEADRAGHALVDLGSPNGTTLNGEPVRGRAPLRSGDLIGFAAAATFRYERTREIHPWVLAVSIAGLMVAALAAGAGWWGFR